ncbi:MAG: hypothetical protein WBM50_00580, partial [Acidimicrobiales bacterium]
MVRRLIPTFTVCLVLASGCSGADEESVPGLESETTVDSVQPSVGADDDGDAAESLPGPDPEANGSDTGDGADDDADGGNGDNGLNPAAPSINDEELTQRLAELGGRLAVGDG